MLVNLKISSFALRSLLFIPSSTHKTKYLLELLPLEYLQGFFTNNGLSKSMMFVYSTFQTPLVNEISFNFVTLYVKIVSI